MDPDIFRKGPSQGVWGMQVPGSRSKAAGRRTTFVASVFCHVCLHSNFDIGFAISDVDFNTKEKVDISENMFL